MNDATQMFTGKSEKINRRLRQNENRTAGCINRAYKALKERKFLDYQ